MKHIKRKNIYGERFYIVTLDNGVQYVCPSVTTVCGRILTKKRLNKWREELGFSVADREAFIAAEYGTLWHKIVAQYIQSGEYNLSSAETDAYYAVSTNQRLMQISIEQGQSGFVRQWYERLKKDMLSYRAWEIENSPEYIYSETPMYIIDDENDFRVAGTIDLVCKIGGKVCVIDFKSNRTANQYTSYITQLELYAHMLLSSPEFSDIEGVIIGNVKPKDWIKKPGCHFINDTRTRNEIDSAYTNVVEWYNYLKRRSAFDMPENEKSHVFDGGIGSNLDGGSLEEMYSRDLKVNIPYFDEVD